jgi:trehalose 6-phosphate phosphatase
VRDILAGGNRRLLARVAASDALLAFDYDGTLAPIVRDPEAARLGERTRSLLGRLAGAYPCLIVSGRSRRDVRRRLTGIRDLEIIGNHGAEPRRPDPAYAARVRGWLPRLEGRLGGLPGLTIENKGFSVAVHYRRSRARRQARAAILSAAAQIGGVRAVGGKSVVNLVPHDAPHKGAAVQAARATRRCDVALYVGDDETDEDVFALGDPLRLLTVRVGRKRRSRAAFYIRDQRRIDVLLERLLTLRHEFWRQRAAAPEGVPCRRAPVVSSRARAARRRKRPGHP